MKSRQTEQPGRGTKAKGLHTMHEECLGDAGDANTVYAWKAVKPGPFIVKLQINGVCVRMELDTGASLTIMSKKMFDSMWTEGHTPNLNYTSTGLQNSILQLTPIKDYFSIIACHLGCHLLQQYFRGLWRHCYRILHIPVSTLMT